MHIYTWRWLLELEQKHPDWYWPMTEYQYWWLVRRMLESKWLMDPPKEVR